MYAKDSMKDKRTMLDFKYHVMLFVDIVMTFLAFVSVITVFLIVTGDFDVVNFAWFYTADGCITALFLIEFLYKYRQAKNKTTFLKKNWWYILASVPIAPFTNSAWYLVHLFRLFRLVRLCEGIMEIARYYKKYGFKHYIDISVTYIVVFIGGSMLMYSLEYQTNPKITTMFDALYFVMTTMTSVGYGDITAITTAGRIVAIVLMVTGLVIFGIFVAMVTEHIKTEHVCEVILEKKK